MGRSVRESDKSRRMFLAVLPFAFLASVNAHGGMTWPPTWQDGVGRPIEALTNDSVFSVPIVKDPNSGRSVVNIKSWLTDQAYTGGVGDEFKGIGPVTNDNNKKLPRGDRCRGNCVKYRNPWAAPGQAPCNHSRPRTCCHCCSRNLPVRSEGRCCQWPPSPDGELSAAGAASPLSCRRSTSQSPPTLCATTPTAVSPPT